MTDHEKRLILRGMSVARGLLIGDALHRAEFEQLVEEINEAIEARHPDWISHNGPRTRRH